MVLDSERKHRFKFGSQRVFDSLGSYLMTGILSDVKSDSPPQRKRLRFLTDVIDLPIPCLISRETLFDLGATIDFKTMSMFVEDQVRVPLYTTAGGHITFRWIHDPLDLTPFDSETKISKVFPSESAAAVTQEEESVVGGTEPIEITPPEESSTVQLSSREIYKVHVHFGHASVACILRICRLARQAVNEDDVRRVVQSCTCLRSTGPDERPIINRRISTFPGQTVVTDTFFPEAENSQRFPAVLFVCDYSKFVVASFLPNLKPESYVNELLGKWIPLMGFPSVILCDNATTFGGEVWEALGHVFNVVLVPAPTKAAHQIGLAERHQALVKQSYQAISRSNTDGMTRSQMLNWACITKNLTPLSGCEVPPHMIFTGRSDLISRLSVVDHPEEWNHADHSIYGKLFRRLKKIHSLRSEIIKWDAENMIKAAKSRVLRKGASSIPKVDSPVQVWDSPMKIWKNGGRMIAETGRNGIIECGRRIVKVPLIWIRSIIASEDDEPGSESLDSSIKAVEKLVQDSQSLSLSRGMVMDPSSTSIDSSHAEVSQSLDSRAIRPCSPAESSESRSKVAQSSSNRWKKASSKQLKEKLSTKQKTSVLNPAPSVIVPGSPLTGLFGPNGRDSEEQSSADLPPPSSFVPPFVRRYHMRSGSHSCFLSEEELLYRSCLDSAGDGIDSFKGSHCFMNSEFEELDSRAGFSCLTSTDSPSGNIDVDRLGDELHESYGNLDLPRIPMRIMMKDPRARSALRSELFGIMTPDKQGIPAGKLVSIGTDSHPPLIPSTVITKLKTNKGFKCRLCVRGDLQSEAHTAFSSAPTASRESLRIAAFLFVDNPSFVFSSTDISRAFTQSAYFHKSDRVWVELPRCIALTGVNWKGEIYLDYKDPTAEDQDLKMSQVPFPLKTKYALVLYKPLYGTRDAPMRWYCQIAQVLIRSEFFPLKSDRCTFARFRALGQSEKGYAISAKRIITSFLLIHVGDIVFTGCPEDYLDLKNALKVFDHDPWEELSEGKEQIFCGIQILLLPNRILEFSQRSYYAKIVPLWKNDFFRKTKL